jgi:hypothetical protein
MASKRPRRIKYNWQDIPRHVSRREYDRFKWICLGAIATGGMSVITLFFAITGQTMQVSNELAEIPSLSVAEAKSSDDVELVKLSGFLVADDPPIMPDDPALKVIRGEVELSVRNEAAKDNVTIEEVLLSWSEDANPVFLSDGEERIPVAIDIALFPFPEAEPDFQAKPKVKYTDESARISKPRAIAYGDQEFTLERAKWGEANSVFTDVKRKVLPHGQSVVVVAGLRDRQIIDPLGNRLKIELGTESEIREDSQRARFIMSFIWFPLAIACYFLARSAQTLNQEFIRRSNGEDLDS